MQNRPATFTISLAHHRTRPASIGGVYPINQYYLPYSGFSPFGFNGRFLYARASVTF